MLDVASSAGERRDLEHADFTGADLSGASFIDADLDGASLRGATPSG